MPVYDYVCLDCHQSFETVLTLNEHDKENPKCPHCGSKNVEQEAAAFFAVDPRRASAEICSRKRAGRIGPADLKGKTCACGGLNFL